MQTTSFSIIEYNDPKWEHKEKALFAGLPHSEHELEVSRRFQWTSILDQINPCC